MALIQTWKSWEKSAGARTAEYKARVPKNALKSGDALKQMNLLVELDGFLREQKKLMNFSYI
jgi:hypothetical protein